MKFADGFGLPASRSTLGNRFGVHGPFYGPQGHRGVDFVAGRGTPVPAVGNGEVVRVLWSDGLGHVVVVRHYLHGDNNDVYSGYCHLSDSSVHVGQEVSRGQTIARSGATGSLCDGAHLHLTMSHTEVGVEYGDVFDPLAYIDKHPVVKPTKVPAKVPTPVFTTARRGEGLSVIAARSGISLPRIKELNPTIKAPSFIVLLGQKVRVR